ncbi:MAG: PP2C family protein-serine/threonine phosphatase [Bacteroidia bacterium]
MIIKYLSSFWRKVTVSGLRNGATPHDRKCILLINRMSMLNTLLMVLFSILGPIVHLYEVLYFSLPFAIAFSLPPLLNKLKLLELSRIYFCLMPLIFLVGVCIHNGAELGDKYFILTTATIPILIFRKKWVIYLLFFINVLMYFFIVWYQNNFPPMAEIPDYIERQYSSFSILSVFGIIFFVVLYFRNDSEDYELELEGKNFLISQKNAEIIDSITYAKRLQEAILPPLAEISHHLPNSFVLYKPKDIVAGDFYFAEHRGDHFFIAAADCTGHGVPGAMVSVVCSNALNRAVMEFGITEPGEILDKVKELILETFKRSHNDVKDGMDISLCAFNLKNTQVKWSGANNPLWYIQNGEMKELTADKQPVGKHDFYKPFTTHTLNLSKGDVIYLFTDGYADQFGGPKGKKFKYKQLNELLMAASHESLERQRELLNRAFEEWRGIHEQIDDVCIIGIKL